MAEKKLITFPEGFWWGSATAAHQIEGGNYNDWSVWEDSEARIEELKREGKNPADFISGRACDSFHRYQEDFDIAQELNHSMHRFSIEWSRIEPQEGKFDHEAMHHYVQVIDALRKRGIEPMVTLWHFTNPVWFSEKGGFLNSHAPQHYERYIRYVVDNLKDRVNYWITFNEAATVYAGLSYVKSYWPPQHKSIREWKKIRDTVIASHILAYRSIKNLYRGWSEFLGEKTDTSHNIIQPKIGFTENNSYLVGGKLFKMLGLESLVYSFFHDSVWRQILPYTDFLGLNYYNVHRLAGSFSVLPKQKQNEEMNWELYPRGLYEVLIRLKKFEKPIFITENGIADALDQHREQFIKDHLSWVWRAIQEGVQVKGYLYWSLLDNFEWARGFEPRFGLVHVNYETLVRTIRPSARAYAKIIKENGFEY